MSGALQVTLGQHSSAGRKHHNQDCHGACLPDEPQGLEQLTVDHRIVLAADDGYLSRALGADSQLDLDYRAVEIDAGDVFVLATDGAYEHLDPRCIAAAVRDGACDLDRVARQLIQAACDSGSLDNLTIQIVRVDALPEPDADEVHARLAALPIPPVLDARQTLDGYTIVRSLQASSRSQLYTVMEHVQGRTLRQWMIDHARPDVETVRSVVEQIARGLRAFHRLEMLHQDLRPENVLIDATGTVKIIDFGSARVAGIAETRRLHESGSIPGTAQYTAPEYFLGEPGTSRSDLFSLGVIAYQMLSGRLPYGAAVARARTRADQRRLGYASVLDNERDIPAWMDEVLRKAVHVDPEKRYQELSELVHDLRDPPPAILDRTRPPLLERNPLAFWKGLSLVLALVILALLLAGS